MESTRTRDERSGRTIRIGLLALVFAFALTLMACGQSSEGARNEPFFASTSDRAADMLMAAEEAGVAPGDSGEARVDGRTREADVSLWATDIVKKADDAVSKAKELGGYSQHESYATTDLVAPLVLERGEDASEEIGYANVTDASLMVRVPDRNLDEYLEYLATLGEVKNQFTSENDVKIEQARYKARVSVLEEEEAALSQIFEQAETVEDMMAVRTRLLDVRTELATATAQVDDIMSADAYSTVRVSMTRPPEYRDPNEITFAGFSMYRLKQAAATGVDSLFELFYFTVGAAIALAPWIILAIIIGLIVRWRIRTRRAEQAEVQPPLTQGPPTDGTVTTVTTVETMETPPVTPPGNATTASTKRTPKAPDGADDDRIL